MLVLRLLTPVLKVFWYWLLTLRFCDRINTWTYFVHFGRIIYTLIKFSELWSNSQYFDQTLNIKGSDFGYDWLQFLCTEPLKKSYLMSKCWDRQFFSWLEASICQDRAALLNDFERSSCKFLQTKFSILLSSQSFCSTTVWLWDDNQLVSHSTI